MATPPVRLPESWQARLASAFARPYFKELTTFVRHAYAHGKVYPTAKHVFRAFDLCPFDQVKVVILGQDPYHGPGQADGLCFSVPKGMLPPPSLRNIFKEIHDDLGLPHPADGDLGRWAAQGVLMLNATLTVAARQAGSHQGKGWETFTDAAIRCLAEERQGVVFMLWGAYAQRKGAFIDVDKHLVLTTSHPSPFAVHRGFFGCRHFSLANNYLVSQGRSPIDW